MRKGIPKTTSGLTLATRKVSSKNLTRLALSVTEKTTTTIPKVSRMVPSIFWALMSVVLMGSPNYWAKVGWMTLTSLSESRSADMGTDFFRKVMGYRMHGTCAKFGYSPLLSSSSSLTSGVPTASTVSIVSALVPVTGVEVVETDTSFLTSGDTW